MGISPSLDINLGVSTNRYFTAEINRVYGIRKPQELAEPAPPPDPLPFSRAGVGAEKHPFSDALFGI